METKYGHINFTGCDIFVQPSKRCIYIYFYRLEKTFNIK